jgi:hypothetical protein
MECSWRKTERGEEKSKEGRDGGRIRDGCAGQQVKYGK